MKQIELEASLARIEADYSERVDVEAKKIADHRIAIEKIRNEKELEIAQHKMEIISSESVIKSLNVSRTEAKAKLFESFHRDNQGTLDA